MDDGSLGRASPAGWLLGRGCAVSELGASSSWVNIIRTFVCLGKVTQGWAEQLAGRGWKVCDTDGLIVFSSFEVLLPPLVPAAI